MVLIIVRIVPSEFNYHLIECSLFALYMPIYELYMPGAYVVLTDWHVFVLTKDQYYNFCKSFTTELCDLVLI